MAAGVVTEQHRPQICGMFGDLRNFTASRWSWTISSGGHWP